MKVQPDPEEEDEDDEENRRAMGVPYFNQVCDSSAVASNSTSNVSLLLLNPPIQGLDFGSLESISTVDTAEFQTLPGERSGRRLDVVTINLPLHSGAAKFRWGPNSEQTKLHYPRHADDEWMRTIGGHYDPNESSSSIGNSLNLLEKLSCFIVFARSEVALG